MPGPSSRTKASICAPSMARAPTVTVPPARPYLIALSIRLPSTCSSRPVSARTVRSGARFTRCLASAAAVQNGRAIDLHPALARPGKLQLMAEHLSAGAERLHQLRHFVEAQRFEDGFAANIDLQIEQSGEGAIGHLDAARLIE